MAQDPASGGRLLWTRTDARDAALACRLAIEKEQVGSGPYNITGAKVALDADSAELVKRHFGEATQIRGELPGRASPMSCMRAEVAFGYQPQFTWSESEQHPE
jgi:nucleoside-diphosphate-sugar epimerase